MSRLEAEVKAKGLTVFARVDHAAGAAAVGLPLPPTGVLIFGNARGGTPLMQSAQTIGIDLPLRAHPSGRQSTADQQQRPGRRRKTRRIGRR